MFNSCKCSGQGQMEEFVHCKWVEHACSYTMHVAVAHPCIFEDDRFFCRFLYHFQKSKEETVAAVVLRLKQYRNQGDLLDQGHHIITYIGSSSFNIAGSCSAYQIAFHKGKPK